MRPGFRALLSQLAARGLDPKVPHTVNTLAQEKLPEEVVSAPEEQSVPEEVATQQIAEDTQEVIPRVLAAEEVPQPPKPKAKKKKKSEA